MTAVTSRHAARRFSSSDRPDRGIAPRRAPGVCGIPPGPADRRGTQSRVGHPSRRGHQPGAPLPLHEGTRIPRHPGRRTVLRAERLPDWWNPVPRADDFPALVVPRGQDLLAAALVAHAAELLSVLRGRRGLPRLLRGSAGFRRPPSFSSVLAKSAWRAFRLLRRLLVTLHRGMVLLPLSAEHPPLHLPAPLQAQRFSRRDRPVPAPAAAAARMAFRHA